MMEQASTAGFSFLCDTQGVLTQIIYDNLGLGDRLVPGQPFSQVVDSGSQEKARVFLSELQTKHVAFDWELNALVGQQLRVLHFSGGETVDGFLITAATTSEEAAWISAELMGINNEHTNVVRAALKEAIQQRRKYATRDNTSYDELTRLNNDLAATQRDLAKKNVELEKLNTLKNHFLGMAAHDLRNPLGVIQTYSEFVLDEAAASLSEPHQEFLRTIHTLSEFMLRLVNDLLDISQIESGKLALDLQPTNLIELVQRNVTLNQLLAQKKQIQLCYRCTIAIPALRLDKAKIEQVLNNLLTNAIKFSYPQSTVEIHIGGDDRHVIVSVQDQGQGIPASELDKLFRPFGQTSVKSTAGEKSTGLGLTICRKIIEGHSGRIWVESEVGKGSKFAFSLPVTPGVVETPSNLPQPAAEATGAGRSLRILLVEDDAVNQKVAQLMLKGLGCRIDVAANGKEAVVMVTMAPYDMVFMDCHMPEMDGFEATTEIRRRESKSQHLPIVAMTADAIHGARERCLQAGMDDYLSKPIEKEELRTMLQRWLPKTEQASVAAAPAAVVVVEERGGEGETPSSVLDPERLQMLQTLARRAKPGLYHQLLQNFQSNAVPRITDLREAIAKEDSSGLRQVSHTLKGAALNIGATGVGKICQQLEDLADAHTVEGGAALLEELEREYLRVQHEIARELARLGPIRASGPALETPTIL